MKIGKSAFILGSCAVAAGLVTAAPAFKALLFDTVSGAPSSAVNGTASGNSWTDPTNVYLSDDNRTQVAVQTETKRLKMTGFNFDLPDETYPGLTVVGVQATLEGLEIQVPTTFGGGAYFNLRLLLDGSLFGNPRALDLPVFGLGSEHTVTKPSTTTDTWGTGGISIAQVEDPDFGVSVVGAYYAPISASESLRIDQVLLTIYYDTGEEIRSVTRSSTYRN